MYCIIHSDLMVHRDSINQLLFLKNKRYVASYMNASFMSLKYLTQCNIYEDWKI